MWTTRRTDLFPVNKPLLIRAALLVTGLVLAASCRPQLVPPPPGPSTPPAEASKFALHPGRWVLVDGRAKTVTVVDNGAPLAVFEHAAFGTRGVGTKHRRGDDTTPLGEFRIGWINKQGKYGPFVGLNYPNRDYVERGRRERLIGAAEEKELLSALDRGERPLQTTKLGGWIGIHGIGNGKLEIHRLVNWTSGCVALDNEQIRRFVALVTPGMIVVIE